MWASRQDMLQLKAMQHSRSLAVTGIGETSKKWRRFERFPWSEPITKVKRIKSAYDSALIRRSTLDCEAPASAPAEFTEPHWPVTLIGLADAINCKPGICFNSCATTAALNHTLANLQFFA